MFWDDEVQQRMYEFVNEYNKQKENNMQIYVGNMSYQMTEESVSAVFAEYGEVETVKLISDRETGRAKGFGFITMTDDAAATKAIEELNGKEIDGRTLRVNEAKPKEFKPRNNFDNDRY